MAQEYFNFDKFVNDLEERQSKKAEVLRQRAQLERDNRTRDLNRLYREHPLAKTFVDGRDD